MGSRQQSKTALEEGVALSLLRDVGEPEPPMDAFGLAELFGLQVVYCPGSRARLVGETVYVPAKARLERQQGLCAHELGHWALRECGEEDSEQAASFVGSALMLPRAHFERDLRATHWDLRALRAKHVHCSAELIARRIVALRDACVSVWDNGRLKARVASPWLPEGYHRISVFERELAGQVLASGDTCRAGDLVWGFAVFFGAWKRVITVCEAEQLALRY